MILLVRTIRQLNFSLERKIKQGRFSDPGPLGGLGEEKWPFIGVGRRDWI